MLKRLFWLLVGFGAGVGSTWYAGRTLRRAIDRFRPPGVADRAGRRVGALGREVRDAVAEGRDAMRAREAELRAALASPNGRR